MPGVNAPALRFSQSLGNGRVEMLETKSYIESLGIFDHPSFLRAKGEGIRKWDVVKNSEETFRDDFIERVKLKIQKRNQRFGIGTDKPVWGEERSLISVNYGAAPGVEGAPSRALCGSCSKLISVDEISDKKAVGGPHQQNPEKQVERVASLESQPNKDEPQKSARLKYETCDELVREVLSDPNVDKFQIEGHYFPKQNLAESVRKYYQVDDLKNKKDEGSQTEPGKVPAEYVDASTSIDEDETDHAAVVIPEAENASNIEESADAAIPGTDGPVPLFSLPVEPGTGRNPAPSQPEPDIPGTDGPVPLFSLPVEPGTGHHPAPSQPEPGLNGEHKSCPLHNHHYNAFPGLQPMPMRQQPPQPSSPFEHLNFNWGPYRIDQNRPADEQPEWKIKYEEAKKWTPANASQQEALKSAISDSCNVLMVYKGCLLRSFAKLFYKTVYEPLDLVKIGVPDLITFLVQMENKIILRKERNSSNRFYLFPKLTTEEFEVVAHIGDLVADQKVNDYELPDPSTLVDCELVDLFIDNYGNRVQRNSLMGQYPRGGTYGYQINPAYPYWATANPYGGYLQYQQQQLPYYNAVNPQPRPPVPQQQLPFRVPIYR